MAEQVGVFDRMRGRIWFLPYGDGPAAQAAEKLMRRDGYVKAAWEPQPLTVGAEDWQMTTVPLEKMAKWQQVHDLQAELLELESGAMSFPNALQVDPLALKTGDPPDYKDADAQSSAGACTLPDPGVPHDGRRYVMRVSRKERPADPFVKAIKWLAASFLAAAGLVFVACIVLCVRLVYKAAQG